jgi:DNA-binding response OmpR family regulator
MNILVIEDDKIVYNQIKEIFPAPEHKVVMIERAYGAAREVRENKYDIVIVDRILKGEDGFFGIKKIREESDIPILMLTIKASTDDIVEALDMGVDDFLSKPYFGTELKARVNSLMSREKDHIFNKYIISKNGLDLNLRNHCARLNGCSLNLTKTEYNILALLLLRSGEVIGKQEIIEHVFDNTKERSDHLVNMHIFGLREKLSNSLEIKTISSRGFAIA